MQNQETCSFYAGQLVQQIKVQCLFDLVSNVSVDFARRTKYHLKPPISLLYNEKIQY